MNPESFSPVPTTLYVTWRSPASRLIHPVGRLTFNKLNLVYEFVYIRSVLKACEDGFAPFMEFPDLETVYRGKELFPLFVNRVMPTRRPDYADFLKSLGLSSGKDSPMWILARTGGQRVTDQIEMFPQPYPEHESGCYVTHFLLRSVRYMPQPGTEERIARLQPGEPLYVVADPQNPVDPHAMKVLTNDKFEIGYLPAYLTFEVDRLQNDCGTLELFVEQVNLPPVEAHHRLLCKIVSCWPDGFQPFDVEAFQPLAAIGAAS